MLNVCYLADIGLKWREFTTQRDSFDVADLIGS
jgi:hypothetical protein